ncbi:hypothetical protein ACFSHP_19985 [Novosphingobium panipatense]
MRYLHHVCTHGFSDLVQSGGRASIGTNAFNGYIGIAQTDRSGHGCQVQNLMLSTDEDKSQIS